MSELQLYQYFGSWYVLLNPAFLILVMFSFVLSEQGTHIDTIYDGIPLIIFSNLIFWVPVAYVTIKIIDIFRKSK